MQDLRNTDHRTAPFDPDATLDIPSAEGVAATGSPILPAALAARESPPHDHTRSFQTPLPRAAEARATLTVLTGVHAGHRMAIEGTEVIVGRADDADLVVDAVGVSRHHARISPTPAGGFCVQDLRSTNGTFVGATRVGVALLSPGDLVQLGPHLRLRFAIIDSAEEALYHQLYEASVRDPLTHVYNRRYLADRLHAEIARARRAGGDLAVLMIDVDCLKTVNDSFGHLAGDQALCAIASCILRALRGEDLLARYGGDEFVVLAVGADGPRAHQLAERIRSAVEGLHTMANEREVRLTTSIGVASLAEVAPGADPAEKLLAMADMRMYAAKSSGKNKVCVGA
jgi:two-component system cell cycle response regulator